MSIIRVAKKQQFLVMSQETVNDLSISWEAKGMLNYLLGRPDNWQVCLKQLEKYGKAGRDKVRKIINELCQAGYIKKTRLINEDTKRYDGWDYCVYETRQTPETENTSVENVTENDQKIPETCFPAPESPAPANPHLTNTEYKLELNKTNSAHRGMASPSESAAQSKDNVNSDEIPFDGDQCERVSGDTHLQTDFVDQDQSTKKPSDYKVVGLANTYLRKSDQLRFIKLFGQKCENTVIYDCVFNCLETLSEKAHYEPVDIESAIAYCTKAVSKLRSKSMEI